ncbi:hypothetical protein C3486_34190 [Streptomyces sp. Ru73]|nr:hypothetical protein C3486_34190 [Streptomyces sp. Ru73]
MMETVVALQHKWFVPRPVPGEPPWARAARDSRVWGELPLLAGLLKDGNDTLPDVAHGPGGSRAADGAGGPEGAGGSDSTDGSYAAAVGGPLGAAGTGTGRGGATPQSAPAPEPGSAPEPRTASASAPAPGLPDGVEAWYARMPQPEARSPRARVLQAIRDAAVSGDEGLVRALLADFDAFFRVCLAPHWSAIREQAEADILHRAGDVARHGLAHALATLHPSVSYQDGTLCIANDTELDAVHDQQITLVPSTLASRCFVALDPGDRYCVCLIYPALRADEARDRSPDVPEPRPDARLGDVLGHTRLMLLRSLDRPCTTTGLAALHHLSPSTVSYHLTRLHRAGLLIRVRDGNRVRYRRTEEADRLLARG